jgi:hypothetical protein
VVLLGSLLVEAGCTTPDAVRQFTATGKNAIASLPPIVKDLPEACVGRQMAERPVTEIADADSQAREACRSFYDLEPRLTGTLDVLANYLNALNELASDEVVTYDKQIEGFASNLKSGGAFSEAQAKAAGGLAKFLADAAASGYQRRKIIDTLKMADADLAVLCDGLSRIIGQDYVRVLENEENALRSRYRDAIQADATKNSAAALIVQEYWRRDLALLNQKKAAAQSAVGMLAKIRDGHRALAAQANQWSAKELVQTIAPYTGSIQSLLADYRKVF